MSNRARRLLSAAAALSALALLWGAASSKPARAPAAQPASVEPASAAAAPRAAEATSPDGRKTLRVRYRVSSEQHVTLGKSEQASVILQGVWTTVGRVGGATEASFVPSRIEVKGDRAPSAAEVSAPIQLVLRDGALAGMGFSASTPRAGRALLTGLATTFQFTDQPGSSWTAEEEDLLGRYTADYRRQDERRVTRKRTRYTALRGPGGLSPDNAASVAPDERTELRFDDQGLASATIQINHTIALLKGMAPVRMTLEAKLERESADEVPLVAGAALDVEPISSHVDRTALARKHHEAAVAGASASELIAEAHRAAHLDRKQPGSREQRAQALRRLASLASVDSAAPAALAQEIRQSSDDPSTVGLLAGALSSSDAPAATNALASLLTDEALPTDVRSTVLTHLALARTPTPESADTLSKAMDKPQGDEAALALGAQAKKLDEAGAGGDAIDQLLDRYARASSPADRQLYLLALGNTGSARVLDAMRQAIAGRDYELARVGTRGLRLIPGSEVDDLLHALILSGSSVTLDAIQAVGHRSPELWRPRLEAAKAQFSEQKRVLEAISAVLTSWASLTIAGER